MTDLASTKARIREFLESNINIDDDAVLGDDENIFSSGYVTSIFAMRLLNFVEELAAITVADDEILLANFSSIDALVALVERHQAVAA